MVGHNIENTHTILNMAHYTILYYILQYYILYKTIDDTRIQYTINTIQIYNIRVFYS